VVSRWLEGIPDDRLEHCPALALSAGFVASHQGDIAKTQRLSMILDAVDWGEDADLRPYHRVLQGVLGLVTLEDLVRHMSAESQTLTDSDPWSTVVHYLHGSALSLVGRFDEARDALLTSLRLSRAYGIPVMQAHAASGLVLMALGGAQEPRFDECVAEIDEVMDAVGMTDIATACPVVAAWSAVRLRQGRADEAEWGAHEAWRAARAMAPAAPWAGMQVRLIVASILSELGDRSGAREALAEAMAGRGAETESPVLDALLQQTVAQCGMALDTVPLTAAELRVLRLLPTHLSFPQIGEELFLSRNTVKSQALSAYRKLGARSRAEAVAEARRLGLLGDFIP
jgi:LuxR family maltose regulon positive regulatory protein